MHWRNLTAEILSSFQNLGWEKYAKKRYQNGSVTIEFCVQNLHKNAIILPFLSLCCQDIITKMRTYVAWLNISWCQLEMSPLLLMIDFKKLNLRKWDINWPHQLPIIVDVLTFFPLEVFSFFNHKNNSISIYVEDFWSFLNTKIELNNFESQNFLFAEFFRVFTESGVHWEVFTFSAQLEIVGIIWLDTYTTNLTRMISTNTRLSLWPEEAR